MIVVGIIGIIASLSYLGYQSHLLKARNRAAIADITTLDALITSYESLNGDVPDALSDLGDHGVGDDPWGRAYRFTSHDVLPGQERVTGTDAINSAYDLWSDGPDGTSQLSLGDPASQDDIIRANDGAFIGKATDY
jgi:general secretion pathway protein G